MKTENINEIRKAGAEQFNSLRKSVTVQQINQILGDIGWPARMTIQIGSHLSGLYYARAISEDQVISPEATTEIGYRVLNTSLVEGTNFKDLDPESSNVQQNSFELAEYISAQAFLLAAVLNQTAILHLENMPAEDRSPEVRASVLFDSLKQNNDWVPRMPKNREIPLIFSADGFFNRIVMPNGRRELITQN